MLYLNVSLESGKIMPTIDSIETLRQWRTHSRTCIRKVGTPCLHNLLPRIEHQRGGIRSRLRLDKHAPPLPCHILSVELLAKQDVSQLNVHIMEKQKSIAI